MRVSVVRWLATVACAAAAMGGESCVLAQTSAAAPADPMLARNLAATCANCHGTNGHARGVMKTLAGMPASEMLGKIAAYRSGAEPATIMHQLSKGYTDEQLRLIAGWFAAQPATAR